MALQSFLFNFLFILFYFTRFCFSLFLVYLIQFNLNVVPFALIMVKCFASCEVLCLLNINI